MESHKDLDHRSLSPPRNCNRSGQFCLKYCSRTCLHERPGNERHWLWRVCTRRGSPRTRRKRAYLRGARHDQTEIRGAGRACMRCSRRQRGKPLPFLTRGDLGVRWNGSETIAKMLSPWLNKSVSCTSSRAAIAADRPLLGASVKRRVMCARAYTGRSALWSGDEVKIRAQHAFFLAPLDLSE